MQHTSPILVTGAAGKVGSIGPTVTDLLLRRGLKVRAMVRREDERAEALRDLGAEALCEPRARRLRDDELHPQKEGPADRAGGVLV